MSLAKTFTTGSLLLLTSALSAAPVTSRIDPTVEFTQVNKALAVMANEVLNNQEEEYIILGSTDYFSGFNAGMTLAISDTSSFTLTGNETLDVSAIRAELLQLEQAAEASGTEYGTGEATAYAYAIVVLNTPFDRSSGDPAAVRNASVGLSTLPPTKATVASRTLVIAAPVQEIPVLPLRREAYLR